MDLLERSQKNNIDQKGIEEANNHLICRGPDHKNVYAGNLSDKFGMKKYSKFFHLYLIGYQLLTYQIQLINQ